ncbi:MULTISPECIES: ABC transporter permease [Cryobacterium]|uniref:ABC transporter permease n=1 Tax=Cryobacterium breve TaxID=1259258 RepID=A0ABY2IXE0_9MICO|nr:MULTISPECIES: ABC transporter permease [Cryobacterium]TFC94767.1 ABC transporter permease [Cryobacterium sp. TmT3-12]TFC96343.1 ABC transporter permease [Cryobacterium breve]
MSTLQNSRAQVHPRHPTPSFARSVWLVATREIVARLRSRAFLISTGLLLLISIGSVVAGGIASQNQSLPRVAVVGSATQIVKQTEAFRIVEADDVAAAEKLVRAGDVSAAVVPATGEDAPLGVRIIALDSPPLDVLGTLSVAPAVSLLEPSPQSGGLVYLVSLGFGLVFFMSAITFGSTIAQSVVEEKQTRVVEILMTTIPVRALLGGKVVGNSIMAFGQIVAIGLLVAIGMATTGQTGLLGTVGPSIVWFAVFFAFGFVMLAALFAATASMVSRQEDVGSATSPVLFLVMIPYFLVIFFNDNATVLAIMSYIPFSAPVGMPMRIFLGTALWWEPLLSLAILLASTVVVILLGSRIYSNSLLRMGARVTFRQALRG